MPSTSKNKPKRYTDRQLSARYPTDLPAWEKLKSHHKSVAKRTLAELFAATPGRAEAFTRTAGKLTLDFSKNRITGETLRLLTDLARAADVPGWIGRTR